MNLIIEKASVLDALPDTSIVATTSGNYALVKVGGTWRGYPYPSPMTSEELLARIGILVLRYVPEAPEPKVPSTSRQGGDAVDRPMAHETVGLPVEAEAACWALMEVQSRTHGEEGRTLGQNVSDALAIVVEHANKGDLDMYVETNYVDWDALNERNLGL